MATNMDSSAVYDRKTFFRILSKQVIDATTYKTKIALLLVDIDRFYKINQLFGYTAGDEILSKFALLLKNVTRNQDYVARIGDNRFAIILTGIMNTGHAELAAHKIIRLLQIPFTLDDKTITVDCTIAISLCPTHASHDLSLLKECESVLYNARQNKMKIGTSSVPDEFAFSEDWDVEMALDGILEKDQLVVFYQPKIAAVSGQLVGAEALLRWNHPTRGLISPDYFIPIAERIGQIKPITNWIFNTALRHGSIWCAKAGPLSVSVNVPPDLILSPELTDQVSNAINLWATHGIKLTIEIIERSLVLEPERSFTILKNLQNSGIDISIDDFGTGYSSLSYFEKLPVNELKIDKSFVEKITHSKSSRSIIKLIVELAHAFDLNVVAEGVTTPDELNYLKSVGCDIIQGYYFAKPMPQEEFLTWINDYSTRLNSQK
jgi:diguanylate cyclase (GGDEF)-like protein